MRSILGVVMQISNPQTAQCCLIGSIAAMRRRMVMQFCCSATILALNQLENQRA
jgi:hypothetical protein